jgi:hypothetical protein
LPDLLFSACFTSLLWVCCLSEVAERDTDTGSAFWVCSPLDCTTGACLLPFPEDELRLFVSFTVVRPADCLVSDDEVLAGAELDWFLSEADTFPSRLGVCL